MNIKKKGHIKPEHGYLTQEKNQYRINTWDHIKKLAGDEISNYKCLILPSDSDAEIKVVLDSGIKEENIYACDSSAAMLANVYWRKLYPKINILGSTLLRAIERLHEKNIRIDIVNFDLCSNLQQSVFDIIVSALTKIHNNKLIMAITLLKGREGACEATLAKMLYPNMKTVDRINIVFSYCIENIGGISLKREFIGEYKSGRQVMSYGVCKFVLTDCIDDNIKDVFLKNSEDIFRVENIDYQFHNVSLRHVWKNCTDYDKGGEDVAAYKEFHNPLHCELLHKKHAIKKGLLDKFWHERRLLIDKIEDDLDKIEGYNFETRSGFKPFFSAGVLNMPEYKAFWRISKMAYHRID